MLTNHKQLLAFPLEIRLHRLEVLRVKEGDDCVIAVPKWLLFYLEVIHYCAIMW